jgi:hypothetical protein
MAIRILIAAGAALALGGPVLAQTAPAKAGSAPAASGMTLQQFIAENGDKWFARVDTNKDGKISPEEFEAFRAKHAAVEGDGADVTGAPSDKAAKHAARMFSRFDADHDGFISRAEADAVLAWRFKRMDTNNDGVLSLEELNARHGKAKVGI